MRGLSRPRLGYLALVSVETGSFSQVWGNFPWFGVVWSALAPSGVMWARLAQSTLVWDYLGSSMSGPISAPSRLRCTRLSWSRHAWPRSGRLPRAGLVWRWLASRHAWSGLRSPALDCARLSSPSLVPPALACSHWLALQYPQLAPKEATSQKTAPQKTAPHDLAPYKHNNNDNP